MDLEVTRRAILAGGLAAAGIGFSEPTLAANGFGISPEVTATPWPFDRYNSRNTGNGTSISFSNRPESPWSRSVEASSNSGVSRRISPPVRSHRIICYTTDEAVVARGSADGQRFWLTRSPESCAPAATPAINDGRVITGDQTIAAWDISTGSSLWKTELSAKSVSAPLAIHDGTVYVGTSSGLSGYILALNIDTGEQLWEASISAMIKKPLAVDDTGVYVVDEEGVLSRIVDGEIVWELSFNGPAFQAPILDRGRLILPWYGKFSDYNEEATGIITTIDAVDGQITNHEDDLLRHSQYPAYYDGDLIITNSSGNIVRQPISGGFSEWDQQIDAASAAPIVVDATVLVGTDSGRIYGFDPDSGEQLWSESVLDEPISGLIAGQDAIYLTGKYTAMGGIHYEPSVDARQAVQGLMRSLSTANEYGVETSAAGGDLAAASQALTERDYTAAIEAASDGENTLSGDLDLIQTTQQTISDTRRKASKFGNQTAYDPAPILETVDEAAAALEQRNPQEAKRLADQAAADLSDIETGFETATAELSALNQTISEASQKDIPLQNATVEQMEANRAFKQAEFGTAASVASRSRSDLQTRIELITNYRNRKADLDTALETAAAEDIQTPTGESMYADAENSFAEGNYAQAAEQINGALSTTQETISRAREAEAVITAAQEFDPMTPFVDSVAVSLGSSERLSAATTAYADGAYDAAHEAASDARSKQTQARIIINGGLLSGVGLLAASKRYDALSKVANYLADQTTDDEVEEL